MSSKAISIISLVLSIIAIALSWHLNQRVYAEAEARLEFDEKMIKSVVAMNKRFCEGENILCDSAKSDIKEAIFSFKGKVESERNNLSPSAYKRFQKRIYILEAESALLETNSILLELENANYE